MMTSVFLDSEVVIVIEYLEKGNTISGDYYASKLTQLKAVIMQKRRGKLRADTLLFQENVPIHTVQVAKATAVNCHIKLLQHLAYFLDLAPSDFYLFPKIKSHLCCCGVFGGPGFKLFP